MKAQDVPQGTRTIGRDESERTAFLARMRPAYVAGDVERLLAEYMEELRQPRLGLALRFLERMYPVRSFLEIAVAFEKRIAAQGLATASAWLLDTYLRNWQCEMSETARHILTAEPVLIYGNHPSLLTPFLVAASINRSDLRIISTSYLHHLLPSYAVHSLPIEIRLGRWRDHYKRGGPRAALVAKLLSLLHGTPPSEVARAANRRSLEIGAAHVLDRGSLLIAPEGGSARRKAWHEGIGHIAAWMLKQPTGSAVHAAPYCERHTSNRRVYASIETGPAARMKRRFLYRIPSCIEFAEPVALEALTDGCTEPRELTGRLRDHYDSLFPA